MAKKTDAQKLVERAMDTLLFEVLEFLAHVSMHAPYGEYADRFPLFRAKPADVEAAAAQLVAEGLAESTPSRGLVITTKGKQYRRLDAPGAVAFFTAAVGPALRPGQRPRES